MVEPAGALEQAYRDLTRLLDAFCGPGVPPFRGASEAARPDLAATARLLQETLLSVLPETSGPGDGPAAALAHVELAALERVLDPASFAAGGVGPDAKAGPAPCPSWDAALLRHLCRLEAALEVLLARWEETEETPVARHEVGGSGSDAAAPYVPAAARPTPGGDGVADPAPGREGSGSGFGISRAMEREEIEAFLRGRWWADLAVAEGGRPYAVPVVYGWDGRHFYVASRAGRKVSAIEANPSVCLTIIEVEERSGRWSSVVVAGRAELVRSVGSFAAALRALQRQVGRAARVTPAAIARMAAARVIRIVPEEITGRVRIG